MAENPSEKTSIIEHYYPVVQAIARSLSSDPDTRDDLTSVGAVKLVELAYAQDAQRADTFGAYLRMSVKGAMLDYLKRNAGPVIETEDIPVAEAAPDVDASRMLERVAELPDQQRKVIEMRRRDMSQSDVGRALGISRQAVSRIENRAAATLVRLSKAA